MQMENWIGKTVDKYMLQAPLEESEAGLLFQARHLEQNQVVALKVLPLANDAAEEHLLQRLFANAEAISKISHPNLVEIYDAGIDGDVFYIAMQLMPHNSLAQYCEEAGAIAEVDAICVAREVAKALQIGHENNLLHLNLSPSSIFITEDEEIKLADFGLGLPIRGVPSLYIDAVGSPLYIAPEVISGNPQPDPRTDLYSLGACIYHLVCGVPPFQGNSVEDLLNAHLSAPVPSMRQYLPSVSEALDQLIQVLLDKRMQNRFSSAAELVDVLGDMLRDSADYKHKREQGELEVEEFLLQRIADNPQDRAHIQDMLEVMARHLQNAQNIPEEARDLADQIIIQEFSDKLGCSPEIIEKIKMCDNILQNPIQWLEQGLMRIHTEKPLDTSDTAIESFKSSFQSSGTTEKKSRIIKSTRIFELVQNPGGDKSKTSQRPMPGVPTTNTKKRTTDALSKIAPGFDKASQNKPKSQSSPIVPIPSGVATDPKILQTRRRSGAIKRLFLTLALFGGIAFLGYTVYSVPEIRREADALWAKWSGNKPTQDKVTRKNPSETDKLVAQMREMLAAQKFAAAKKLIAAKEMDSKLKKKLAKEITRAEQKALPKIPSGIGWFGEKMPEEMRLGSIRGEYIWKKDDSIMVYVKKGKFLRGNSGGNRDEKPEKWIELSSYYIDKYELTNKQYQKFVKMTGHRQSLFHEESPLNKPNHPVVGINWRDAMSYAKWAGKRLPTEAEWEKAARGGINIPDWNKTSQFVHFVRNSMVKRTYPWGNELQEGRANYRGKDKFPFTSPVGQFPEGVSPYGCEDMIGNVSEWCADRYAKTYYQKSIANPKGPGNKRYSRRVYRGGGWESAENLRCSRRGSYNPEIRYNDLGVRLAR